MTRDPESQSCKVITPGLLKQLGNKEHLNTGDCGCTGSHLLVLYTHLLLNKGGEMKKFRAVDESHQRVYYEAIFEAKDEDDAERMVADGMVTWNETRSKIDDDNVSIEEVKDEL